MHISEISWGRVNHPSEVVHEGQELDVKVLKVDKEKGRISLGRKQVLPDPWDDVETKYPVGAVVKGEVTRTAPFGAFVQIEPGVEGLVHISEISQQHVAKPEEVVNSGDQLMVKVLRTRPDERKISLSIKQADQMLLEGTDSQGDAPEVQPEVSQPDSPEPAAEALEDVYKRQILINGKAAKRFDDEDGVIVCRDGDLIEIIAEKGQANVVVSAAGSNIVHPQIGTWVKGLSLIHI